jgi:hypothetical protein
MKLIQVMGGESYFGSVWNSSKKRSSSFSQPVKSSVFLTRTQIICAQISFYLLQVTATVTDSLLNKPTNTGCTI